MYGGNLEPRAPCDFQPTVSPSCEDLIDSPGYEVGTVVNKDVQLKWNVAVGLETKFSIIRRHNRTTKEGDNILLLTQSGK